MHNPNVRKIKHVRRRTWMFVLFLIAKMVPLLTGSAVEGAEYVDDSAFYKHIRPPVAFSHDAHNDAANLYECNECHHLYHNGQFMQAEDSIDMQCSECHMAGPEKGTMDLIRSYHLRCKGCHVQLRKGPVMCGECHVK